MRDGESVSEQLDRIEMKLDQLLRSNASASYHAMVEEAIAREAVKESFRELAAGKALTALDRLKGKEEKDKG